MPQPVFFSIPVTAEVAGGEGHTDVLTVDSRQDLQVGDSYIAVSQVAAAGIESLRRAGDDDPAWVTERYLQLPGGLPARLYEIAAELTRDAANRFDKADAIEDYLRTIEYSETNSPPPEGRDLVEWVLDDERRGYCAYYSSAIVVLARASGTPDRLAAGCALGEYIPTSAVFRQRQDDAHTWPEVYFPGYGWVEFEPTAADPEIERPSLGDAAGTAPDADWRSSGEDSLLGEDQRVPVAMAPVAGDGPAGSRSFSSLPIPALLLLALAGLTAFAGAAAWHRPFRGLTAPDSAVARLGRVASWLAQRPTAGHTQFDDRSRRPPHGPHASAAIGNTRWSHSAGPGGSGSRLERSRS